MAPRPALTDVSSASRGPGASNASDHHWVVNPVGGQPKVLSALNELIAMTASGT